MPRGPVWNLAGSSRSLLAGPRPLGDDERQKEMFNVGNVLALPGAGGARAGPGTGARRMAKGSAALPAHARAVIHWQGEKDF